MRKAAPIPVRYDDRLDTILRQPGGDAGARVAIWRQLVDLLAQGGNRIDLDLRGAMLSKLDLWRSAIPEEQRRKAAQSLAGRCHSAELVASFGSDQPVIAAPVILSARLPEEDWVAIIPSLPPASRALLRERRDLPESAMQLLQAYQSGDFALPRPHSDSLVVETPQPAAAASLVPGSIQISELVARIEAYRQTRIPAGTASDGELPIPGHADQFRFETSPDGVINWMQGAPRGPIVGLSLADMADARSAGVDGHAAGAFRQRNRFRDARLLVAGEGPSGGQWLISGDPVFDRETGRFTGYRGIARRPAPDEMAGKKEFSVFGQDMQPDSIRQLVHELRTPLNAIRGFAEMIEGQFLGPVASGYRDRARDIIAEANTLLATFEDLDGAAKIESGAVPASPAGVEAEGCAVLAQVVLDMAALAKRRSATLEVIQPESLLRIACSPPALERMYGRLVSALLGLAAEGETIPVSLYAERTGAVLSVGLPARLKGTDAADLLDPNFIPAGDWPDAPALGLGFSLRLVANLAQSEGGALLCDADNLSLNLPRAQDSADGHLGRI